jgi:hypothetical protein
MWVEEIETCSCMFSKLSMHMLGLNLDRTSGGGLEDLGRIRLLDSIGIQ